MRMPWFLAMGFAGLLQQSCSAGVASDDLSELGNAQDHLQLRSLVTEVLDRNPDIAALNARVRAAGFIIPRVQAPPDPEFMVMTNGRTMKDRDNLMPEVSYQLSQTIPFPGKLRLRGKIAERGQEAVQSDEDVTRLDVIVQTKRLYYQLLFNCLSQTINRNNQEILKRFVGGALAVYKVGTGEQEDILKAQIELQQLDDELLQLESKRVTLVAMINALRDLPPADPVNEPAEVFSPAATLDYDTLEAMALRQRPELHGLQALVEEQKTASRLANLEIAPDITVLGQWTHLTRSGDRAWGAGIKISIPLWFEQKQRNASREAKQRSLAHQNRWYAVRAAIRSQIKELLANIHATDERITLYATGLVPKTVQTLAAQEAKYRTGSGDFLMLLDTRRQLQTVQLSYQRLRVEREILLAELERAVGGQLSLGPGLRRGDIVVRSPL